LQGRQPGERGGPVAGAARLLGAVDALLAAGDHDLAQLLGDHVVRDLRRVRGQELVLLLLLPALDALEAVLVAVARRRRAALVLVVGRFRRLVGCVRSLKPGSAGVA